MGQNGQLPAKIKISINFQTVRDFMLMKLDYENWGRSFSFRQQNLCETPLAEKSR